MRPCAGLVCIVIDRKILENLVGYVTQMVVAGRSESFSLGFVVSSLHNIIAQDQAKEDR